jgi:hypothetical protein
MKVFVTGGTGLIGRALINGLVVRKDQVVCATRRETRARSLLPVGVEFVTADPTVPGSWQEAAADCDTIVNLAGEPIGGGRWSERRKRRIRRSRLQATRNVVAAAVGSERVRLLVNASATGYYGDGGDHALDEASEPGRDFLARLCLEWEACAREAESRTRRVALLRTGVVLAPDGGALPRLALPFRLFVGGALGSGRQYFPWVHIEDVVRAILTVLDASDLTGPVNVVAPDPPTAAQFARALARALGRPCGLPVPALALRLAMGELADALLASQRVVPRALRARGFSFAHERLDAAFADLLR